MTDLSGSKNCLTETQISYPKLMIKDSILVIEPKLDTSDYWLFDTTWHYGSDLNYVELYSSISGYGKNINSNKKLGIVSLRESMSPHEVDFLLPIRQKEISDKTKNFFTNIMKNHNIGVDFDTNILSQL